MDKSIQGAGVVLRGGGLPITPPRRGKGPSKSPEPPYTPFDHTRLEGGILQSKQSPVTQSILRSANTRFRVKLATQMPFPDSVVTVSLIKSSFLEGCTVAEAHSRVQRAHDDPKYAEVINTIVRVVSSY